MNDMKIDRSQEYAHISVMHTSSKVTTALNLEGRSIIKLGTSSDTQLVAQSNLATQTSLTNLSQIPNPSSVDKSKLSSTSVTITAITNADKIQGFVETNPLSTINGPSKIINEPVEEDDDDLFGDEVEEEAVTFDKIQQEIITTKEEVVIVKEEVVIVKEEVVIEKKQTDKQIDFQNKQLRISELLENALSLEQRLDAHRLGIGYSTQLRIRASAHNYTVSNFEEAEQFAIAQFMITAGKLKKTTGSTKFENVEDAKKAISKINDYVLPEIKTDSGRALNSFELEAFQLEIIDNVCAYLIKLGLILSDVAPKEKEKAEDIDENKPNLSLEAARHASFTAIEFKATPLSIESSIVLRNVNQQFIMQRSIMARANEERKIEEADKKFDILKSQIINHEIQVTVLKREVLKHDNAVADLTFRNVLLDQRRAA